MTRRPRRGRTGPGLDTDPGVPDDIPVPPVTEGAAGFASLDRHVPLALLPVRIEARFLPDGDPTELVVRILPDLIHADGHRPELSGQERALGASYWETVAAAPDDTGAVTQARAWLAGQVGAHRAVWIARVTRPGPRGPGAPKAPAGGDTAAVPAVARLLPARWAVIVQRDQEPQITVWSRPVPADLPIAPALVDMEGGAEEFLGAQGLRWMIDLDEAVRVGMAVRIPLAGHRWLTTSGASELLVLGVRAGEDPRDEGARLDALLAAHLYTRGLDVVPAGTPTNTTDAGPSGVSLVAPDLDALFAADEGEGGGDEPDEAPEALLRSPAADALHDALGLPHGGTLDRVVHSRDDGSALARAMNAATWPATLAHFLTSPLARAGDPPAPLMPGARLTALREWFTDWVRGGGPLPTIRCGPQPYGLLPVSLRLPPPTPRELSEHIAVRIELARGTVTRSVPNVAQLDPDAADSPPAGDPGQDTGLLAEVLGAVPHPLVTAMIPAGERLAEDGAWMVILLGLLDIGADEITDVNGNAFPAGANPVQQELDQFLPTIFEAVDAGAQAEAAGFLLGNLRVLRSQRGLPEAEDPLTPYIDVIADLLVPLFEEQRDRADEALPISWLLPSTPTAVGADGVVRLVGTSFGAEDTSVVVDLVSADGDLAATGAWLDGISADLGRRAAGELVSYDFAQPAPLLRQMLQAAAVRVETAHIGPMRDGVDDLRARVAAALAEGAEARVVHAELARALRETLGTVSYRLDAWATSLASNALALTRSKRPAGIQIGAFGWLLDVRPRATRASQGFIHAPSLDQAATAAVLRSGWSAFGAEGAEASLAVDLSAPRVRAGREILDAVRVGQDLARHLGARLERALHDRRLDTWIDDIRVAVHGATDARGPVRGVVDGLVLARAYSDGIAPTGAEQAARSAVDALAPPPGVRECLRGLARDLDAVGDLVVAQSVHGLLRGGDAVSAAALSLAGAGDAVIPPVRVTDGPRDVVAVTHRVVAAWRADAAGTAGAGVLAAAEPAIAAWAEELMPDLSRVMVDVVLRDEAGGERGRSRIALDALGIEAIDAAVLCGPRETQAQATIAALVAAHARTAGGAARAEIVIGAPGGPGELDLDEFGLMASALTALLGRSRALGPADLVRSADGEAQESFDEGAAVRRAADVIAALEGLAGELDSADARVRVRALGLLAAADIDGAAAALAEGAPPEALGEVAGAVAGRIAGATATDGLERLRSLIRGRVPVLPRFTPPDPAARAASESAPGRRASIAADGHRWLRQMSRVRPDMGALHDLLVLSDAFSGRAPASLAGAQVPDLPGSPWIAVGRPGEGGEHLGLLSVTGPEGIVTGGPVCGLVVDGWVDMVPAPTQPTGVAVHFDAPTSRPPQSVLLALPDPSSGFGFEHVRRLMMDTLSLARCRAVGPTQLDDFRHLLPAAYMPETTVVSAGGGDS